MYMQCNLCAPDGIRKLDEDGEEIGETEEDDRTRYKGITKIFTKCSPTNRNQLNLILKFCSLESYLNLTLEIVKIGLPGYDRGARPRGNGALHPHPGAAHRWAAVEAPRADAAVNQPGK